MTVFVRKLFQQENFLLSKIMKMENFKVFQNVLDQISSRDDQIALERNFEGQKIYKIKLFKFYDETIQMTKFSSFLL